jgi:hypothetical protein
MWVLLHGVLNIVGLKYNVGITYVSIFNDGRFNNLVQVLSKFVLLYGFILQVLYVMHIGIVGILYHNMDIAMGIPSHSVDFKGVV